MIPKRKGRRNAIQNTAIVLLSVSAVLLFAQAQLYNLGSSLLDGGLLSSLFQSDSSTQAADDPGSLADVAAPVQIAVTGDYGRYGQSGLSTTDDAFSTLGPLLGEALGSAGTVSASDAASFQAALGAVSVYCDFLQPLPLELLAGLTGSSPKTAGLTARSLLLSVSGSGVTLYLWDGDKTYSKCSTYVTPENLREAVSGYELGNAFFAFELGAKYTGFAPLSLFISGERTAPVLSASSGPSDTNALLTALGFNPHTNSRYTVSGAEVVVEGNSSVRIASDGTVTYQGGSDGDLRISAGSGVPTLSDAVLGAYRLMLQLLSGQAGNAQLCLQSAAQSGSSTTLQFGLLVNGLPVRFSNDAPAAVVQLSDTTVSGFTLRLRQYASTAENSSLLPLRQAAAIAGQYPGGELTVCYVDTGGSAVSAQWLAN